MRAFEIDRTEVTVADYTKCLDARRCTDTNDSCTGCQLPLRPTKKDLEALPSIDAEAVRTRQPTDPVRCVTYFQADDYCAWVHKRLPTEEEWELAADGIDGRAQPWGDDPPTPAVSCWRNGSGWEWDDEHPTIPTQAMMGMPCRVGSFASDESPFGVRDLAGNVAEWTSTIGERPAPTDKIDPAERFKRVSYVTRGDDFLYLPSDFPVKHSGVGSSRREIVPAMMPKGTLGFRCARSLR